MQLEREKKVPIFIILSIRIGLVHVLKARTEEEKTIQFSKNTTIIFCDRMQKS